MYETDVVIDPCVVQKVTGFVLPVGNGAVGKSSLPAALDINQKQEQISLKSVNLEFGYVVDRLIFREKAYQILQQYLVLPGQKEMEGISGGRSFEKVVETYRFLFKQIDVVLLSYKLVEADSFNDLEFWINQTLTLCNPSTQFILVGTHLDQQQSREVTPGMISNGSIFVKQEIQKKFPGWRGSVPAFEVSTVNRQNTALLRNAISVGILRARQMQTSDGDN